MLKLSNLRPDPYGAIKAINQLGVKNPLNPREVVIDFVKVEVAPWDDMTIWLKLIESMFPKEGRGTIVLRKIIEMAKQYNVGIYLDPLPFNGEISSRKLVQWYKANGFVKSTSDFKHGLVWKAET